MEPGASCTRPGRSHPFLQGMCVSDLVECSTWQDLWQTKSKSLGQHQWSRTGHNHSSPALWSRTSMGSVWFEALSVDVYDCKDVQEFGAIRLCKLCYRSPGVQSPCTKTLIQHRYGKYHKCLRLGYETLTTAVWLPGCTSFVDCGRL